MKLWGLFLDFYLFFLVSSGGDCTCYWTKQLIAEPKYGWFNKAHEIRKHAIRWNGINIKIGECYNTHLLSTRSVLFPTRTIITSVPRSVRTSSIHFDVFKNDCRSKKVINKQVKWCCMLFQMHKVSEYEENHNDNKSNHHGE